MLGAAKKVKGLMGAQACHIHFTTELKKEMLHCYCALCESAEWPLHIAAAPLHHFKEPSGALTLSAAGLQAGCKRLPRITAQE